MLQFRFVILGPAALGMGLGRFRNGECNLQVPSAGRRDAAKGQAFLEYLGQSWTALIEPWCIDGSRRVRSLPTPTGSRVDRQRVNVGTKVDSKSFLNGSLAVERIQLQAGLCHFINWDNFRMSIGCGSGALNAKRPRSNGDL